MAEAAMTRQELALNTSPEDSLILHQSNYLLKGQLPIPLQNSDKGSGGGCGGLWDKLIAMTRPDH